MSFKIKIQRPLYSFSGSELTGTTAADLVHYSISYRQCLLNLQLWLHANPRQGSSPPVEAICSQSNILSNLHSRNTNRDEVRVFYDSNIPIVALNRWRLLPNYHKNPHHSSLKIPSQSQDQHSPRPRKTRPKTKTKEPKTSLAYISKYLSTISFFDRTSSFDQEVRTTAKSDCNRGIGDYPTREPVHRNFDSLRQIQCWTECTSLQSLELGSDSFGHMAGLEENLCFDTYQLKAKAMEMTNWRDKLFKAEMETDGLISTNFNFNNQWYSMGRKWSTGQLL